MKIEEVNSVFLLGIDGIGMSGLARYFKTRGCSVHGYDKTKTELTESLQREGIIINYSEDVNAVPKSDLYVFTPAIPKSHPAFSHVSGEGNQWYKRSEVLQLITAAIPTLAVAGTHGKTTTTALLAHILTASGVEIAAFVGGIMSDYGSNVVLTEDPKYIVVEADEFDRSFHKLSPEIGVITSIDPDHLDVYGSIEQVRQDFQQFASNCKKLVLHDSLKNQIEHENVLLYGDSVDADILLKWRIPEGGKSQFSISGVDFQSNLPGHYNALNTSAAVGVATEVQVRPIDSSDAVRKFSGIQRRFEIKFDDGQKALIDDYAHHPRELEAVIRATRELYAGRTIAVVFQPHLYSRTRDFEVEFVTSLSMADEVILLPIYPARELPIEGVSSANLLKKLPLKTKALVEKSDLVIAVLSLTAQVVLMLGAGDIDQLVDPVAEAFAN